MIDPILYYSMHACYSQLKTVLQYIMYSLNPQIREKFILSLDGETKKFSAAVKSLIELHRTIERFNMSDNQPELVQQLAAAVAEDSCKWVRTGWPLLITSKTAQLQYTVCIYTCCTDWERGFKKEAINQHADYRISSKNSAEISNYDWALPTF